MKKLVRNVSDAESKDFWESAERSAEAVKKRPQRANVGIDFEQAGVVALSQANLTPIKLRGR